MAAKVNLKTTIEYQGIALTVEFNYLTPGDIPYPYQWVYNAYPLERYEIERITVRNADIFDLLSEKQLVDIANLLDKP